MSSLPLYVFHVESREKLDGSEVLLKRSVMEVENEGGRHSIQHQSESENFIFPRGAIESAESG